MFKRFVKDYLTFNRKERFAALFIIPILMLVAFAPYFFPRSPDVEVEELAVVKASADNLDRKQSLEQPAEEFSTAYQYERTTEAAYTEGELFQFDPNTASAEIWQRLGLNSRTIKTILNYRNKGGKFYKPEDLQKIWGMPAGFYERVKNYMTITSVARSSYPVGNQKPVYERRERTITAVNINNGDTSAWAALPGIGSKLSARIVNFKNRLGGFYSVEQVKETYGLPDSTFQKIKPYLQVNAAAIRKINVNTATKDELKVHPYIRWNLANAIVEYRNQHGAFKSIADLKNIAIIDDATFQKIAPYLTL